MRLLLDESVPARLRRALSDHDLSNLPIAVLVLDAPSNTLAALEPLIPRLQVAIESLVPRTCRSIGMSD